MDERTAKIRELLHEAAETHHQVFRITDGADEDWEAACFVEKCADCFATVLGRGSG